MRWLCAGIASVLLVMIILSVPGERVQFHNPGDENRHIIDDLGGPPHASGERRVRTLTFEGVEGTLRGQFEVEVADTEPLRQRGLMFRESLPTEEGMLFIFDDVAPRTFWMKNTKISLDMLFVSDERVVQGILSSVPPMNQEPRSIPGLKSRYVIELGAGVSAARGIHPGDLVKWEDGK